MSDATKGVTGGDPSVPADPGSTVTPTVTHYQQVASQVAKKVAEAFALVADFEAPHATTKGFVQAHRNIPPAFIATTSAAVQATTDLQVLKKFDAIEAEDALQFQEAFRPVVDSTATHLRNLKFTMDAKMAKVAADALVTYEIAKGIARDPGSADLAAHVENMKRDLGRSRPKKRKPATKPATPPPQAAEEPGKPGKP
jgi:hypothetical protein